MNNLMRLVVLAAVLVVAGSAFVASALASNIPYNGGPVQHAPTFYAVYWLPSGQLFEPGVVGGNQQYQDRINQYLTDLHRTNLANVVSQYYDSTGSTDMTHSSFGGSWVDTTDYPHDGSKDDPLQDSNVQDAVDRALEANESWQTGINATVFVFTAKGINMCFANSSSNGCTPEVDGSVTACAYHWFAGNTIYAGMPEAATLGVDSSLRGCAGSSALPQGDIYADTEITAISHELFEAATDPTVTSWSDPAGGLDGAEIGDKCNGDFGWQPWFGPSGYNVDGRLYYMQQEWSNITGQCEGSNQHAAFFQVYGPFAAKAGDPTGSLLLAKTLNSPSLVLAPSPTISWGDGSSEGASIGTCVIEVCDLNTNGHTYATPGTYTMTLTYSVGCCIDFHVGISISVLAKPLTIQPHDQQIHYGDPAPDFTAPGNVDYVGLKPGDTVTGLTCAAFDHSATQIDPSTAAPTGSGDAYNIICSNAVAPAYNIAYLSGRLTIIPAPLKVTADDASRRFGQANPPLTATLSGFVNGQTLATSGVTGTAGCSTTATPWSAVGSYPIDCNAGTLASTNYTFTPFVPGLLSVTSTAPCLTGTVNKKLDVAAGQALCLAAGAKVTGPVKVAAGGALDIEGATITGPVTTSGAVVVRLCGATVNGPLKIEGSTGLVLVGGDTATGACAPNTILGPVALKQNQGGAEVNGNTITGPLTISGTTGSLPPPDTGSVHAVGNIVSGPVKITP